MKSSETTSALEPAEQAAIARRIQELKTELPAHVRLIAVSKTKSADHIRAAYAAGVRDFGENRVQEAIAKQEELHDLSDICWHLLGPLQKNKVRKALQQFDWIHSVDNLKLAERMNRIAGELVAEQQKLPRLCLQVKLRPDPNKAGWPPDELLSQLPQISRCNQLRVSGVMVIPPLGLKTAETLTLFEQTRIFSEKINTESKRHAWSNIFLDQLSMGMSGDYPLAVNAGSTMVRLGRTIFGTRG